MFAIKTASTLRSLVCPQAFRTYTLEKCLSIEMAERAWRKKKGGKMRQKKKEVKKKVPMRESNPQPLNLQTLKVLL